MSLNRTQVAGGILAAQLIEAGLKDTFYVELPLEFNDLTVHLVFVPEEIVARFESTEKLAEEMEDWAHSSYDVSIRYMMDYQYFSVFQLAYPYARVSTDYTGLIVDKLKVFLREPA